jgi:hypothetical protein
VGLVVDEVALGQVLSEYFVFPANSYFTKYSIFISHPGLIQLSGVPSGLSLTPPHHTPRKLEKVSFKCAFIFLQLFGS